MEDPPIMEVNSGEADDGKEDVLPGMVISIDSIISVLSPSVPKEILRTPCDAESLEGIFQPFLIGNIVELCNAIEGLPAVIPEDVLRAIASDVFAFFSMVLLDKFSNMYTDESYVENILNDFMMISCDVCDFYAKICTDYFDDDSQWFVQLIQPEILFNHFKLFVYRKSKDAGTTFDLPDFWRAAFYMGHFLSFFLTDENKNEEKKYNSRYSICDCSLEMLVLLNSIPDFGDNPGASFMVHSTLMIAAYSLLDEQGMVISILSLAFRDVINKTLQNNTYIRSWVFKEVPIIIPSSLSCNLAYYMEKLNREEFPLFCSINSIMAFFTMDLFQYMSIG